MNKYSHVIFTYILILPKRRVFLAAVFWMWVHSDSLKATKCQSYNGDVFDKLCIWQNQHARRLLESSFFISAELKIEFTIWQPRSELSPVGSVNVQAVQ